MKRPSNLSARRAQGLLSAVGAVGLLLGIFLGRAGAQQDPVRFSAAVAPAEARRGEVVTVKVTAEIEEPWHLYSLVPVEEGPQPTKLRLAEGVPLELQGGWREPTPITKFDAGFQKEVQYHEKRVTFEGYFKVRADAPLGAVAVSGTVEYMVCSDEGTCLFPEPAQFEAPLTLVAGEPRAAFLRGPGTPAASEAGDGREAAQTATAGGASAGSDAGSTAGILHRGLWQFLLFAAVAGWVTLLTPCVFPLIPITVSYFTKQAGESSAQMVKLALLYAAGIALMYSSLGLILAATMGATGAQQFASNLYVNLVIAALFILFAFSLFGLFELQLPASWLTFFDRKSQGGGTLGVLLMGLTFTLAAFSCTVPFVGLLLAAAAQGQWFRPIVGMLTYSAALSSPFLLLALFPQWMARLPQSGGWLNTTQVTMGFIELAAAFKFLSGADLVLHGSDPWLTRPTMLAIWTVIFAFTGLYLLGKIRLPHDPPLETVGVGRMLFSLSSFAFALILLRGAFGAPLGTLDAYLPPTEAVISAGEGPAIQAGDELVWHSDYEAALAEARRENRPLFVDFTGYTCSNCRWMEANIFPQPEVRRRLKEFVLAKLYIDGGDHAAENRRLMVERFGTAELPFYVLLSPAGEKLAQLSYTTDARQFAQFLGRGRSGN